MAVVKLFGGIYNKKKVLVTGHTGFKGSWLSLWLNELGANVVGYALAPNTTPNHFNLLELDIVSILEDIGNTKKLDDVFRYYTPDIVFHLAAQPLVRYSYKNPLETYETNVMGTLKLFEICKKYKTKAIVTITSDKVYKNKEQIWGYKEDDELGGYDPYSSSKSCVEIVSDSYKNSFFNVQEYKKTHNTLMATCRAGNVIGGGDWAEDRIVVDLIRSYEKKKPAIIRNPNALRPWQHVLEPLSGYLQIGQKLLEEKKEFASAWNFGPNDEDNLSVERLALEAQKHWVDINFTIKKDTTNPHEATLLKLDSSKAKHFLHWESVWSGKDCIEKTINWYKNFYKNRVILTCKDLGSYIEDAKQQNIGWVK